MCIRDSLRADEPVRQFTITAKGAEAYSFSVTHGDEDGQGVRLSEVRPNVFRVTLSREILTPTRRVDIMVAGRNKGTGWGAPSYISFARMDPSAPYSDPALTILPQPKAK